MPVWVKNNRSFYGIGTVNFNIFASANFVEKKSHYMYSNSYIYNWPDVAKFLNSVFCVKMISNELIKKSVIQQTNG